MFEGDLRRSVVRCDQTPRCRTGLWNQADERRRPASREQADTLTRRSSVERSLPSERTRRHFPRAAIAAPSESAALPLGGVIRGGGRRENG